MLKINKKNKDKNNTYSLFSFATFAGQDIFKHEIFVKLPLLDQLNIPRICKAFNDFNYIEKFLTDRHIEYIAYIKDHEERLIPFIEKVMTYNMIQNGTRTFDIEKYIKNNRQFNSLERSELFYSLNMMIVSNSYTINSLFMYFLKKIINVNDVNELLLKRLVLLNEDVISRQIQDFSLLKDFTISIFMALDRKKLKWLQKIIQEKKIEYAKGVTLYLNFLKERNIFLEYGECFKELGLKQDFEYDPKEFNEIYGKQFYNDEKKKKNDKKKDKDTCIIA